MKWNCNIPSENIRCYTVCVATSTTAGYRKIAEDLQGEGWKFLFYFILLKKVIFTAQQNIGDFEH